MLSLLLPSHHPSRSLAGKPGAARKALAALDAESTIHNDDNIPSILDDDEDQLYSISLDGSANGFGDGAGGDGVEAHIGVRVTESVRSIEELEKEAAAAGYGKMYVAMGGGREGLEACAAIEALCEVNGDM